MTDEELLAKAVAFDVGPELFINGYFITEENGKYYWTDDKKHEVEYRHHIQVKFTGSKWVIFRDPTHLMAKTGVWAYARLPSEQEDDFLLLTRFDTAREAINFFKKWRRITADVYEVIKETHVGYQLWMELDKRVQETIQNKA